MAGVQGALWGGLGGAVHSHCLPCHCCGSYLNWEWKRGKEKVKARDEQRQLGKCAVNLSVPCSLTQLLQVSRFATLFPVPY